MFGPDSTRLPVGPSHGYRLALAEPGPGLTGCPPFGEAAQVWAWRPPAAGRAESLLLTDAAVADWGLFGLTPGPGPRLSSSVGLSADLGSTVRVPAVTFRVLLRSDEYVRARRRAADSAQAPAAARRPTASRSGRGRGPEVPSPV